MPMFVRRLLLTLSTLVAVALPGMFAAAQEAPDGSHRAIVTHAWSPAQATPGMTVHLGVVFDIEPHWHIQAGVGSGDERPGAIPTSIRITGPSGWSIGKTLWPEAVQFTLGEGEFAQTLAGYEGMIAALTPITVPAAASPGEYSFDLTVEYQACDDSTCDFPTTRAIRATLEVLPPGSDVPGVDVVVLSGLFERTLARHRAPPPSAPPTVTFAPGERVKADVAWHEPSIAPGGQATLGVILHMAPTWHIQAGAGSGDESGGFIATSIALTLPDGFTAGDIRWPKSHTFLAGEGEFVQEVKGYEGTILVAIPVRAPAGASPGEYPFTASITYQACDPLVCDMPKEAVVRGTLVVAAEPAGEPGSHLEPWKRDLFAAIPRHGSPAPPSAGGTNATDDGTGPIAPPALTGHDTPGAAPTQGGGTTPPATTPRPTFFGYELPDTSGALGTVLLLLFSVLGGFILNLTPCVLPVIPIKILTISQHAGSPGKSLVLGLWMALGVVAFWVAIGVPAAFFTTLADPSRLFGIWWLTLGIGALIGIMGLGIMGLFMIQLPQSVYAINPKADSPGGSFMFGVMTAVLGLPCFGFVAGALLAGSATLPPATIILIFTSLGIGMAAPYLVLSARPGLVNKIPRTGPASELVKQVMGLLLIAAAAYFIGAGLIALVSEKPYMARQLHWWAVAVFVSIAGLWLVVRTFQISKKPLPRLSFLLVGVLLGAAATLYALDSTAKARFNWLAMEEARADSGGAYATGVWNEFTPAAFQAAREAGHVVVLDFTAEWCINCKILKASVLNRDPVRTALGSKDVVSFTVDLTSTEAPGWRMLRDLGRTGIPLLVIYTPGVDEPWQANAYTPQQVMEALDAARATRLAATTSGQSR
ncbi:MAG: thioredoxin family protein [Phycisphaeraceae bacterium]|nr:MAG: thioredoxin family protein [Phycisphaeraceae bacterium]